MDEELVNGGTEATTSIVNANFDDHAKLELSTSNAEQETQIANGVTDAINESDQEKQKYYCGCGPFHPKVLQIFPGRVLFTTLMCCFAFMHSSIVSGFISTIITSIETRYSLNSISAGAVASGYDFTVVIAIIFASYFGGHVHKPRAIGFAVVLLSVGSLVFASPQFFFGRYRAGTTTNSSNVEVCMVPLSPDCGSSTNGAALFLFLSGDILIGVSGAILYTVGIAYLDEIVFPKHVSLYLGVISSMAVLGPTVGYGLGSAFLKIHVDLKSNSGLTEDDPAWVGAWWIPFVLISVVAVFLSIPFFMFPKWLPDSHLVKKERMKEMAKVYSSKYANEDSLTILVKMFPVHILRLLRNASFMFSALGLAVFYIFGQGLISFTPKYIESQFNLRSSTAGLVTGGIGIPSATLGVLTGAFLVYICKLQGRKNAMVIFIVSLILIPSSLAFLLRCPSIEVAGITTSYADGNNNIDDSQCVSECQCISSVYQPICGADELTYFSPCRAGCVENDVGETNEPYVNCTCIMDNLKLANTTGGNLFDDELLINSTATDGYCTKSCVLLIPAALLLAFIIFVSFIQQIPYNYFVLRVVADDQRSLALGLYSFTWRVIGAVPGPLIFGALFDHACLSWQDDCGARGNCWIYDTKQVSINILALGMPCLVVGTVLHFFAVLTYPKHVNIKEESREQQINNE